MNFEVLTTCHTQYAWDRSKCIFYSIEHHSKVLLHTLELLYICTLCDNTNINTIIAFVPHVSGDGFNGGSDSYLQFRDTHAPCLLKLCISPSNGIVRWWLFPEFCAELPLGNFTPTVILNNPVYYTDIRIFRFIAVSNFEKRFILQIKTPFICATSVPYDVKNFEEYIIEICYWNMEYVIEICYWNMEYVIEIWNMLLKYVCSILACFLALTSFHVFSKIRTNCSPSIWKRNTETSCCW